MMGVEEQNTENYLRKVVKDGCGVKSRTLKLT